MYCRLFPFVRVRYSVKLHLRLKTHGVENRRRFSTPCVFSLRDERTDNVHHDRRRHAVSTSLRLVDPLQKTRLIRASVCLRWILTDTAHRDADSGACPPAGTRATSRGWMLVPLLHLRLQITGCNHPSIFQDIQAHSAWPSLHAMSTGDDFGHRWRRNG